MPDPVKNSAGQKWPVSDEENAIGMEPVYPLEKDERLPGVYEIRNKISDKRYIGSSKNALNRLLGHQWGSFER